MVYTTYKNSSLCRMTPSAAAVEYQSAVGGEANAQVYNYTMQAFLYHSYNPSHTSGLDILLPWLHKWIITIAQSKVYIDFYIIILARDTLF